MRKLRAIALCIVTTALLVSAGTVSGDSGASDDPDDAAGALDIKQIGHTNDESSATYRVEMHDDFEIDDIYLITWDFDFDNDGRPAEGCILLQRLGSTSMLRGSFYGDCGPEAWATADGRHVDGNAIEIGFPLIDLVEGGGLKPGETYSYRVTAKDQDGIEDTAPEDVLVEHSDVPAPTARAGSADTQLGFPGQGTSAGENVEAAARPGRPQDTVVEGETVRSDEAEAGATDRVEGPLAAIPIIGNLCSGPLCFVLGAGAPLIAAVVVGVALLIVRRRRNMATETADEPVRLERPVEDVDARRQPDEEGSVMASWPMTTRDAPPGSRSYPGNT